MIEQFCERLPAVDSHAVGEWQLRRVFFYTLILFLLCTNLALAALVRIVAHEGNVDTAPFVFSARRGPDTLSLQEIAANAATDAAILQNVVHYYHENRERLSLLWDEDHPTRLAGMFSMYVTHVSSVYGETTVSATLDDYLDQPRAHCGSYTWAQIQIATALGLSWQTVEFPGDHTWLEILVDGQWEIFDATTNVWLNHGVQELMQGLPRQYRNFYSPVFDINRPDARLHLAEGYNLPKLRDRMTTLGVAYMPYGELTISPGNLPEAEREDL